MHVRVLPAPAEGRGDHRGHARPIRFCLGFAYWSGTGPVPKDSAQSARWWKQAAERGHPGAQTMLAYQYGRGLGVARSDAARLLRAAIAQG